MPFFSKRKIVVSDNYNSETNIIELQKQLSITYAIPIEISVAHYTPSIFPLIPIINPKINELCKNSWKIICSNKEILGSGFEVTGITLFYNDFYERLKLVDENHKIEAVLTAHSTGNNKIADKGAIIIRIINYILSISQNDHQTQFRLFTLGKAHSKRAIRPYMYSVFVQNMLYTISNQLGVNATHEVMEAWVNMFAFVMKSMLPLAIKNQVLENEININTKTDFSSDHVKTQILEKQYDNSNKNSPRSNTSRSIHSTHNRTNSIHFQQQKPHIPQIILSVKEDTEDI